jgi:hypothetical protein
MIVMTEVIVPLKRGQLTASKMNGVMPVEMRTFAS